MKFAWLPFLALAVAAPAQQPGTIEVHSQEWVDVPERHLSIRGTLNGDTPFIVMLPPRETWKGRIIQWLSGGFGGRMTGDRGQSENDRRREEPARARAGAVGAYPVRA